MTKAHDKMTKNKTKMIMKTKNIIKKFFFNDCLLISQLLKMTCRRSPNMNMCKISYSTVQNSLTSLTKNEYVLYLLILAIF